MRLDQYLAEYYPEKSRSQWQKYINGGYVSVNEVVVTSSKHSLGEDDEVSYVENQSPQITFEAPIIYEDDNVLVLNKPIGMLTHAKGGIVHEQTVADIIRPLTSYCQDTNRPGIVHRLDRATSGVIATVKNENTASLLQRQFTDRKTKKTYIAIVEGHPKHPEARLELPIERDPKKPSQFRVGPSGKSASTSYRVLAETDKYSLVELKPETGRTHQLRVHMQYIGCPILGDTVYGNKSNRMYLHAHKLEITIPEGQRKVFEAPIPSEFKKLFPENSL